MENINKIIRFAKSFLSKAQLGLGESQLTRISIQNKMREYKKIIEPIAEQNAFYAEWFGNPPGIATLEVINKILDGGKPTPEMKAAAVKDIKDNVLRIDIEEFLRYVNAYEPL